MFRLQPPLPLNQVATTRTDLELEAETPAVAETPVVAVTPEAVEIRVEEEVLAVVAGAAPPGPTNLRAVERQHAGS
jgi:hypothetical protein